MKERKKGKKAGGPMREAKTRKGGDPGTALPPSPGGGGDGGCGAVRPLINAPIASGQRDGKTRRRRRARDTSACRARQKFQPEIERARRCEYHISSTDGRTDDRRTIRGAASAMPSALAGPVPVTVTTFGKFLLVEATFSWRGTKQDTKYEGEERGKGGRERDRSVREGHSLTHSTISHSVKSVVGRTVTHSPFSRRLSTECCKFATSGRGPGRGTIPNGGENQ